MGGGEKHKETAKTAQETYNHACPTLTPIAHAPPAITFVNLGLDSTVTKEVTANSKVEVIIAYDGLP